jgi:hypothetical protein
MTRQYGAVPYITEPVTTIAQINASPDRTDYRTILDKEAQNLERLKKNYSEDQLSSPTFNQTTQRSIGVLNWSKSTTKYIFPEKCFVPLNVVLGDIYLELGEYEKAATCYYQYLRYTGSLNPSKISVNYMDYVSRVSGNVETARYGVVFNGYCPILKYTDLESIVDYNVSQNSLMVYRLGSDQSSWRESFAHSAAPGDVISYIPMAVNYTMGQTSNIPAAFGYNYYGTDSKSEVSTEGTSFFGCPKMQNIQVVPSQAYRDTLRNAQFYYYSGTGAITVKPFNWIIKSGAFGDSRAITINMGVGADSSCIYTNKPSTAYVLLYRNTTVWLHLAEAINRMGYPDAAFAVLKNGLHNGLDSYRYKEVPLKSKIPGNEENDSVDASGNVVLNMDESHLDKSLYYITPESWQLLTTTLPFGQDVIFKNGTDKYFAGIHSRGAGAVEYLYSTYRYDRVVESKIADISTKFTLGLTPGSYTKDDYINAVEDLICDEYAMEFAFEGTRFSDLRRIALHKNQGKPIYGVDFGDRWLSHKLQNNAAGITTKNCYLPYK